MILVFDGEAVALAGRGLARDAQMDSVMNALAPHAVELLDRLVLLCREASCEYGLAVAHVHEPEFRAVLESAVVEHAEHARHLQEFIAPHPRDGTAGFGGPAHNLDWSDVTGAILRGDEHGIFEACLRGERKLLAAYTEAAEDPGLSPDAAEVVREQLETVAARHSLFRACCERGLTQHAGA